MGDLTKLFKTDEKLEISGVWEDVGNGIRVKVARFNNTAHKRVMEQLMKPHQHAMRTKSMSEEVAEKLLVKGMAKTILLDWEGVEVDGKPIQHSVKNAEQILSDFKDFRDLISNISTSMEIYRIQETEETEKNSETTSTGA